MIHVPPRRLLVAYDFSRRAALAWRAALALGRLWGCGVEALHVVDPMESPGRAPLTLAPSRRGLLRRRLEQAIPGASSYFIALGDPAFCILEHARWRRPDLIVLPYEGRRGVARLLKASVAEIVAGQACAPVLVLKGCPRRVRSVLFPILAADAEHSALRQAAGIAAALSAHMTVMRVRRAPWPRPRALSKLESVLETLDPAVRAVVKPDMRLAAGSPARRLAEESGRHDLLVLPLAPGRAGSQALRLSEARRLMRLSRAAVLTLPSE